MDEVRHVSPTEALFECLRQLYRQSSQLLLDCDRLMSEREWEPVSASNNMTAGMSGLPTHTDKWFPHYAFRYYVPSSPEDENEKAIDTLRFVSTHFTSSGQADLHEPILVAGSVKYLRPMSRKEFVRNTRYNVHVFWFCRVWFFDKKPKSFGVWYTHVPEVQYVDVVKSTGFFALPLYDVISSEVLEEKVINRLFQGEPAEPASQ